MLRTETSDTLRGTTDFCISRMVEHDLLEVVAIEEASGLSRWGWDAYHSELLQKNDGLMFVASSPVEEGSHLETRLSGFIASRMIGDELHVNNVAVRDEYRRMGIGRRLLERVLAEGLRMGARMALLEVRAGNSPARALYSRCGFAVIGRRSNYYSEPIEDALVMRVRIESSA